MPRSQTPNEVAATPVVLYEESPGRTSSHPFVSGGAVYLVPLVYSGHSNFFWTRTMSSNATVDNPFIDVFTALETCRAIRYLKPDPIPRELLERLVHYATRASNPGNSQLWSFVILQDAAKK